VLLVIAEENKLDIELVHTQPPNTDPEYLKLNPLNCIPTFVGSNGFILSEVMAIAIYCKPCPQTTQDTQDEPNYKLQLSLSETPVDYFEL
jgi:hypothetical protein